MGGGGGEIWEKGGRRGGGEVKISEEGSGDRTEGRWRRIKGEIIGRRGGEMKKN